MKRLQQNITKLLFALLMVCTAIVFGQNTTKQIGAKFITDEVILDGYRFIPEIVSDTKIELIRVEKMLENMDD